MRLCPSDHASALIRCINQSCGRSLALHDDGRLFQFEVVSISLAANDEASTPFDEKPVRETVHFWLCETCASQFSLVLEPANGLRMVPITEQDHYAAELKSIKAVFQSSEC